MIILRFDDITNKMNWSNFNKIKESLLKYKIRPIIGVIANCKDPYFDNFEENEHFWNDIHELYLNGWEIAIHGYDHFYINNNPGNLKINKRSEFAGLSYDEQYVKIYNSLKIFEKNNIYPRLFMAPSHSYDDVTLKVLFDLNINLITDGYGFNAYFKSNIIHIPQLTSFFVTAFISRRLHFTVCIHLNELSEKEIIILNNNIDYFAKMNLIGDVDISIQNTRKYTFINYFISNIFMAFRYIKRIG